MIIAISSPPNVDKSELARKLAAEYSLAIERDPSAEVCRSWGFQTLYEMPDGLQREVRLAILRDHRDAVLSGASKIYAHSAFEMLADWMRWFWASTPAEEWERVLALGAECAERYDEVHHLGSGRDLPYDGYVWFDRRNAAQQDRLIRHLYGDFQIVGKIRDSGSGSA